MPIDAAEELVSRFLSARGLQVERPTKAERRLGKTPDFRVLDPAGFCFYCEVKAVVGDDWLGRQLANAVQGEVVGGSRSDPVFNRLTDDIHTAVQQFDGVNSKREHPNVLALVNYDQICGLPDLLAVLTGNFYADDGTVDPIYRQYSEGRIRNDKLRIDLYLWLDSQGEHNFVHAPVDPVHSGRLSAVFGHDLNRTQRIDAQPATASDGRPDRSSGAGTRKPRHAR